MLFNSLTFILIFLPVLLVCYFFVNDKNKNYILLIFSILFYAWGEPKFIFLILLSIFINYYFSKYISKSKKKKTLLILSLFLNFLLLFVFKYLNSFIGIFEIILNRDFTDLNIILPIGISFYTFQVVSYIIDVYRGDVKPAEGIVSLANYLLFFPQLIAGPIVRYTDINKQFKKRVNSLENVCDGIRLFIIGLSKKVIISNSVGYIVDNIFIVDTRIDMFAIIFGMLSFTIQIYYDFSGYSDMALGLAKMFGFNIKENFNYPYISKSISEFWRRWHISLGTWFKDYVYIPLGGSRVSEIKWIRNIFIVWILTGIWHGNTLNFLIWGVYFAVLLVIEKLFNKYICKIPNFIRWLVTFLCINFGFLIFRISDINSYTYVNRSFLDFVRNYYYLINYIPYLILGYIFMFPIYSKIDDKFKNNNLYLFAKDIVLILLFVLCIFGIVSNSYSPFIYFNF